MPFHAISCHFGLLEDLTEASDGLQRDLGTGALAAVHRGLLRYGDPRALAYAVQQQPVQGEICPNT